MGRLLKSGAVWGLQLWLYLGFTLLVINVPQYHELQASVFAIALELVICASPADCARPTTLHLLTMLHHLGRRVSHRCDLGAPR